MILHISCLPSRRSLAEASVASEGHDERAPRAAVELTARAEALPREQEGGKAGRSAGEARTHFCFWRTKTKNISPGSEHKIRGWRASGRAAREPPISRFPPSRLPVVSCSIARSGPKPPQKLLRFRLQLGSPSYSSTGEHATTIGPRNAVRPGHGR